MFQLEFDAYTSYIDLWCEGQRSFNFRFHRIEDGEKEKCWSELLEG